MLQLFLLGCLWLGCSPFSQGGLATPRPGARIGTADTVIQMPHYAFRVSPNPNWCVAQRVSATADIDEIVDVQKKRSPFYYHIQLMRKLVLDRERRPQSAAALAKTLRAIEVMGLTLAGGKADYQVMSVDMHGEHIIGEKRFYTLVYATRSITMRNIGTRSKLYLYFPKERNHEWYLIAHFVVAGPLDAIEGNAHAAEFYRVLESIAITP